MKEDKESFTRAMLRIARRDNARRLLEVLHHLGPDENLASSFERVYRQRYQVRPRKVRL